MSVTALELEEVLPDVSIAELEQRWAISRNALKARARALGVELVRKGPTLTVWPGDRVADGDRLDAHLKAGGSMASFPGVAAAAASDSSQLAVTPQDRNDSSQLAVPAAQSDQLVALAAALASAMPQPPADPLARARGLAEAADHGLVLTNDDLAALLRQGVNSWSDGHEAFGYRFRRHQPGGKGTAVLWTVERAIGAGTSEPSVTATAPRMGRVGFGAAIEASATVLGRVELPHWQPSLPSANWH